MIAQIKPITYKQTDGIPPSASSYPSPQTANQLL